MAKIVKNTLQFVKVIQVKLCLFSGHSHGVYISFQKASVSEGHFLYDVLSTLFLLSVLSLMSPTVF